VRPWQHVLESLNGYITLAEFLYTDGDKFSSAWNFGPNISDCLTSLDITKKLISISQSDTKIEIGCNENEPHEAGLLMLDTSKARNLLGWKPILSIGQSLQWILNWNNAYKNHLNIREASLKQISDYENLIKT
jgi:CDP-glucose 4,6-dehydratase